MKRSGTPAWQRWLGTLGAVLVLGAGPALAQEIPIVTGQHWTRSSLESKKAYLVGLANAFQVEAAYEASTPPTDAQSIVPRLMKGMRGQTLDGVREFLDAYYAKNPGRIDRPVVETIWFEIVVPTLAKGR